MKRFLLGWLLAILMLSGITGFVWAIIYLVAHDPIWVIVTGLLALSLILGYGISYDFGE